MRATIEDYVKRHGLTKREIKSFGQWIPAYAVPPDRDQSFEIFAGSIASEESDGWNLFQWTDEP